MSAQRPRPAEAEFPLVDFGGEGQSVLFLHANGYPPDCYRGFLKQLSHDFRTLAMLQRPLWRGEAPDRIHDWKIFSEDLLRVAATLGPFAAIGHSLGATVVLRAALREPDRFAALVLVDPVLFPPHVMRLRVLLRSASIAYRFHPLIRGAMRRRRGFGSREQMFERYRRRRVFRYLSDEDLRICIEGMTTLAGGGGFQLVYRPEWEARVYYTAAWNDWDLWRGISDLTVPTLTVRGEDSDTFWRTAANAVQSRNAGIRLVTLGRASHLAPLERPRELAELTKQFLREYADWTALEARDRPGPASQRKETND